jgi:uncharacterized membrane protein
MRFVLGDISLAMGTMNLFWTGSVRSCGCVVLTAPVLNGVTVRFGSWIQLVNATGQEQT